MLFSDELDSYMYQTVGHQAIDLYSEAMGLPLYRRTIQGSSLELGRDYKKNENDEVEDLFVLLRDIQVRRMKCHEMCPTFSLSHGYQFFFRQTGRQTKMVKERETGRQRQRDKDGEKDG